MPSYDPRFLQVLNQINAEGGGAPILYWDAGRGGFGQYGLPDEEYVQYSPGVFYPKSALVEAPPPAAPAPAPDMDEDVVIEEPSIAEEAPAPSAPAEPDDDELGLASLDADLAAIDEPEPEATATDDDELGLSSIDADLEAIDGPVETAAPEPPPTVAPAPQYSEDFLSRAAGSFGQPVFWNPEKVNGAGFEYGPQPDVEYVTYKPGVFYPKPPAPVLPPAPEPEPPAIDVSDIPLAGNEAMGTITYKPQGATGYNVMQANKYTALVMQRDPQYAEVRFEATTTPLTPTQVAALQDPNKPGFGAVYWGQLPPEDQQALREHKMPVAFFNTKVADIQGLPPDVQQVWAADFAGIEKLAAQEAAVIQMQESGEIKPSQTIDQTQLGTTGQATITQPLSVGDAQATFDAAQKAWRDSGGTQGLPPDAVFLGRNADGSLKYSIPLTDERAKAQFAQMQAGDPALADAIYDGFDADAGMLKYHFPAPAEAPSPTTAAGPLPTADIDAIYDAFKAEHPEAIVTTIDDDGTIHYYENSDALQTAAPSEPADLTITPAGISESEFALMSPEAQQAVAQFEMSPAAQERQAQVLQETQEAIAQQEAEAAKTTTQIRADGVQIETDAQLGLNLVPTGGFGSDGIEYVAQSDVNAAVAVSPQLGAKLLQDGPTQFNNDMAAVEALKGESQFKAKKDLGLIPADATYAGSDENGQPLIQRHPSIATLKSEGVEIASKVYDWQGGRYNIVDEATGGQRVEPAQGGFSATGAESVTAILQALPVTSSYYTAKDWNQLSTPDKVMGAIGIAGDVAMLVTFVPWGKLALPAKAALVGKEAATIATQEKLVLGDIRATAKAELVDLQAAADKAAIIRQNIQKVDDLTAWLKANRDPVTGVVADPAVSKVLGNASTDDFLANSAKIKASFEADLAKIEPLGQLSQPYAKFADAYTDYAVKYNALKKAETYVATVGYKPEAEATLQALSKAADDARTVLMARADEYATVATKAASEGAMLGESGSAVEFRGLSAQAPADVEDLVNTIYKGKSIKELEAELKAAQEGAQAQEALSIKPSSARPMTDYQAQIDALESQKRGIQADIARVAEDAKDVNKTMAEWRTVQEEIKALEGQSALVDKQLGDIAARSTAERMAAERSSEIERLLGSAPEAEKTTQVADLEAALRAAKINQTKAVADEAARIGAKLQDLEALRTKLNAMGAFDKDTGVLDAAKADSVIRELQGEQLRLQTQMMENVEGGFRITQKNLLEDVWVDGAWERVSVPDGMRIKSVTPSRIDRVFDEATMTYKRVKTPWSYELEEIPERSGGGRATKTPTKPIDKSGVIRGSSPEVKTPFQLAHEAKVAEGETRAGLRPDLVEGASVEAVGSPLPAESTPASEPMPGATPFTQPTTVPGTTPGTQPFTAPFVQPITIPGTTPSTVPITTPITVPVVQPGIAPITVPFVQPGITPAIGVAPATGTSPAIGTAPVVGTAPVTGTAPIVTPIIKPIVSPEPRPVLKLPTKIPTTTPPKEKPTPPRGGPLPHKGKAQPSGERRMSVYRNRGVTWRQGRELWVAVYPPFDRSSIQYSEMKPANAVIVKDAHVAWKSVKKLSGGIVPATYSDWADWF